MTLAYTSDNNKLQNISYKLKQNMKRNMTTSIGEELEELSSIWLDPEKGQYYLHELTPLPWDNIILGPDKANDDLYLSEILVAIAPDAGPIAMLRKKTTLFSGGTNLLKDHLCIFTSCGYLLNTIVWKDKEEVVAMDFNEEEWLVIVTVDCMIYLINPMNIESIIVKNVAAEIDGEYIEGAKVYENMLILVTNSKKIYKVLDWKVEIICDAYSFERTIGYQLLEDILVIEAGHSQSKMMELLIPNDTVGFYWVKSQKSELITVLNAGKVCKLGKVQKLGLVPAEKKYDPAKRIVIFSGENEVFVARSDNITGKVQNFTISYGIPESIQYCDAITLVYPEVIVILSPNTQEEIVFDPPSEGSFRCFSEIDGIRIFTQSAVYFLTKVPKFIIEALDPVSGTLQSIILKGYQKFLTQDPTAEETISEFLEEPEGKILTAINALIAVSTYMWEPKYQKYLLKAATFAKTCANLTSFNSQGFSRTLKELRVLNQIRHPRYGRLFTFQEYSDIGPSKIIKILRRYHQYLLAIKLSQALGKEDIGYLYEDLIIQLLKSSKIANEDDLYNEITTRLKEFPNVSYRKIAKAATESGHQDIAIKFFKNMDPIKDQIPILISMRRFDDALSIAVKNCEFDAVNAIVTEMRKMGLSLSNIFKEFSKVQGVEENPLKFFVSYTVQQELFNTEDKTMRAIQDIAVNLEKKEKGMKELLEDINIENMLEYNTIKTGISRKTYKERETDLIQIVSKKESKGKISTPMLKSLLALIKVKGEYAAMKKASIDFMESETVFKSLYAFFEHTKNSSELDLLCKKLEIDKKYSQIIKLRTLAKRSEWGAFMEMAKKEKPKLPPAFLANLCLEFNNPEVALTYMRLIGNNVEKVDMMLGIDAYKEAIEVAVAIKDEGLVEKIRQSAKINVQPFIDQALKGKRQISSIIIGPVRIIK
eukprot:TRINITY_DN862_c0_g2_i1.p2 TRINITY_DN862_c0_g2~~TRINITY_DN862_c0_g2_i1.p2  ORF type:complete len:934 (-),score=128.30 TRINITY_DN862_c0_g2_i1:21414-24215(-)